MKIQELAIIFVIIILPISMLLSAFTQQQIQTINMQSLYDTKLTAATYDAIKAFQLNSMNNTYTDLTNSEMRDIEASVGAFKNSITSAFEMTGHSQKDIDMYIPALVYTLYDGFYIYSPYDNVNYQYEEGTQTPTNGNGEKLYGLKPYISYSCRYKKGTTDVVITYALDNYITVRGYINDKYVNKSGYLIDNIEITNNIVKYRGIEIKTEQLKEDVLNGTYNYAKINGTKYYLMDNYIKGTKCITYISNGKPTIQYKEDDTQFSTWENLILNNNNAQDYYKEAKEFTDWFKSEGNLKNLQYSDAVQQTKDSNNTTKIWENDNRYIFEDNIHSIEDELSNFNQHRLSVIRYKIETNLAVAISNYNIYSGAATTNVFEMPELKENEWDNIINKVSLISFLQGLPIGGKIYNGYSIVTNSESDKVILEENIYLLGNDKKYHRIGDKQLEGTNSTVLLDVDKYAKENISAGRLNLDFERKTLINGVNTYYYYPLKKYNASYDSIVMRNNITTYDDIYVYIDNMNDDVKKAFYTALGRERYSLYKKDNLTT